MKRRDFLIRVGGALVAVPAVLQLTACGDDGGGGSPDAPAATSYTISSTMGTHIHMVTVQCADLSSTSDVTYTSTSSNAHTHQVVITAAELAMIANGDPVTVTTTDGAHTHAWTVTKPANAC